MNEKLKINLEEIVLSLSNTFRKVELSESLSKSSDANFNYKIVIDKKNYLLKVYKYFNKRRIISDILLQSFLYDHKLPCQKIIDLKGELLFKSINYYYSVSEFIDGKHPTDINIESASKILDVLKRLHTIGRDYHGNIGKKSLKIPQIENGLYKTEFREILKRYLSIGKPKNRIETLIHGDFHFDNVLISQNGSVFLLDLEFVKKGDPLEDLAGFIFYTNVTNKNQNFSPNYIFDYFINENNQAEDIMILKDYLIKTSLRYCLGSIWQFNRRIINQTELNKRFKTIKRAENIDLY